VTVRTQPCDWCGEPVGPDDGFRASEAAGERHAAFCRLEHVVPWVINGAHWEAGAAPEPPGGGENLERCAHCGQEAGDARIVLVRHRGEHRIADAFCGTAHLLEWAKAGGRFAGRR
jgi:hypothetical protein